MTVIMCMPVLARGRAPLLSSPLDHASGRQLGRNAHVGSVSCQRRQGRGRYAVVTAASSPAPVQRVAIVGGGIAGLSLAHALKMYTPGVTSVDVLERNSEPKSELGGALNINGGAALLHDLGLGADLLAMSNPLDVLHSRTTDGDTLMRIEIRKNLLAGGAPALMRNGAPVAYTVMRHALIRLLAERLPSGLSRMRLEESVVGVDTSRSDGAWVQLANGGELGPYDLVVGADGIRSKVRASVFGESKPIYSGIRIVFGVASTKARPIPSEAHQWFGDGMYCLAYTGGKGEGRRDVLAVCQQDPVAVGSGGPAPAAENADWTAGQAKVKEKVVREMRERKMPADVVALAESADRLFEIGVCYHAPMDSWSDPTGRVVLMGDACHAMPPFMGQGANQGIQDAVSLAKNLAKVAQMGPGGAGGYGTVQEALRAYERTRKPPTSSISESSKLIGALETQGGPGALARNAALWVAGTSGIAWQKFLSSANPVV